MLDFRFRCAQLVGQTIGSLSRDLGLGTGSVISGRLARRIDPAILSKGRSMMRRGCIFVTGTNGKSTTTYYLIRLLESLGYSYVTNGSGANMSNGIATACLSLDRPVDYGVFEVDEALTVHLAQELRPTHILLLNLSRDQLDRYTELESLVGTLKQAAALSGAEVIYNAGSPYAALVGHLVEQSQGYRVMKQSTDTALDLPVCLHCRAGVLMGTDDDPLHCTHCQKRFDAALMVTDFHGGLLRVSRWAIGCPTAELAETLTATATLCLRLSIPLERIIHSLERTPPLPAHERILHETVSLVLAKNPESFARQLQRHEYASYTSLVLAINRNPADGHDTSWLWDIPFERLASLTPRIAVTGQAADDLCVRLKVAGVQKVTLVSQASLKRYLQRPGERILVLANYTAYQEIHSLLGDRPKTHALRHGSLASVVRSI